VSVVVLLKDDREAGSVVLEEQVGSLAARNPATKFVKIRADEAIADYPRRNVPTVFVYRDGNVAQSLVGLGALSGRGGLLREDILEWILARAGAIRSDLTEDPRERVAGEDGDDGEDGGEDDARRARSFVGHLRAARD
jgi:hypothetical protein